MVTAEEWPLSSPFIKHFPGDRSHGKRAENKDELERKKQNSELQVIWLCLQ